MGRDEDRLQTTWVNSERNLSCRDDTRSSDTLGVCRDLCRRWNRERGGERRYEPRESAVEGGRKDKEREEEV